MTKQAWEALPQKTKDALIELIDLAVAAAGGIFPDESVKPIVVAKRPYTGPPRQPPAITLTEKIWG